MTRAPGPSGPARTGPARTEPARTEPAGAERAGTDRRGRIPSVEAVRGVNVRIRLLGGFAVEVEGQDVAARPWRLRKARTVIKVLALAPDQRMHRDRLLELLWPDRTAAAAANNLHQALHVARRAILGPAPGDGVLAIRDGLLRLHADSAVDTDVADFRRLAANAFATGDPTDLTAAIEAYTGDLLPEDRFEDWSVGPREDLRHTWRDLLVAHARASAGAGRAQDAAQALERALRADPLHEPAVRALMRLLAGLGQRAEALGRYERLRRDLAEEYGGDPDPATRRLYRDLLSGSVEAPGPGRAGADRTNLRPALTSFVGRERQLAEVARELSRSRLVTLTGPGGVGKTRLAEQALHGMVGAYRDGVWVVDLVPVTAAERIPDAIGDAMALDPAAGADPTRILAARLAPRQALLLLDNCEHLVDACNTLVRRLLSECPDLRILATSREPLHVPGEVTMRVPSLGLPARDDDVGAASAHESVRLLVDRARHVRPGFDLDTGNLAAVVEICRRLDGVPLAIELAAARLAHLEPVDIADRLGDALAVLGSGDRMTRNATLRATLEWSHGLLTEPEQVLLRRLSVFAGSFTLAAIEGVCAGDPLAPAMILDCLAGLVDKSMVQVEPDAQRSRYRLLDTICQFGAQRLEQAGERAAVQAAHRAYFLDLALRQDPDRHRLAPYHPQQLDVEHDNLRAALALALSADPDRALLLAVSLWRFWLARGHFGEGAQWLRRALAAAPTAPGTERSRAALALMVLEARQGHTGEFVALGSEAVAAAADAHSPVEVALTKLWTGFPRLLVGDLAAASGLAGQGLADARELSAVPVEAVGRWLHGLTDLFHEQVDTAVTALGLALDTLERVDPDAEPFLPAVAVPLQLIPCGRRWVPVFEETALSGRLVGTDQAAGHLWSALGSAHRLRRDLPAAAAVVARAEAVFAAVGDDAGRAQASHQAGCVARDLGRHGEAHARLDEALAARRGLGDRRGETLTLSNLGLSAAAAGDLDGGRRLARLALAQAEEVDDGPAVAGSLLNLSAVELFAGDTALAASLAEQAVEAFRPQGYPRLTGWALLLAGELALSRRSRDAGRRRAAEAARTFERAGCRIGADRASALLAKAR
jgi:predicted ATPase/DNA-binding SARP family transcriptional activator